MKNKIILALLVLSVLGCKDKQSVEQKDFYGTWQRDFEPMPNAMHHVEYEIDKDTVSYSLHGVAVNSDYKLAIDTITKENRIVAHKGSAYYVIFIKPYGKDSVEIFKEQKPDFKRALDFPQPSNDYKENHNQGWNMYYRK